jgi:hypothetical protein
MTTDMKDRLDVAYRENVIKNDDEKQAQAKK